MVIAWSLAFDLSSMNAFNKTANLQAKTYFPLQNILNMILTRRVNNELGMQFVRNSLAVLDASILFQDVCPV